MKLLKLLTILVFTVSTGFAQVGINTETPDASSVLDLTSTEAGFLLPRMTETQRNAITNAATGLIIYNTDTNSIEINTGTPGSEVWSSINATNNEDPKSLTMYYRGSGNIGTTDDTFFNLPVGGQANEIDEINNDFYTVLGDGEIRLEAAGEYVINASFSVTDLRGGDRKFILAVFVNGTRRGYLSRGFARIPGTSTNTEFWGTSGIFQYEFAEDDVVTIEYVLNNDAQTVNPDLLHIGILKL